MPNGSLSLAAALHLLAFDPGTGKPVGAHTALLVRAAALTELAQRGLLTDSDGRPCPVADAMTGDSALDGLLELIGESRPRTWATWVEYQPRLTEHAVRDQLVAHGYLRAEVRRVLGLFPLKQYRLERTDLVAGMREDAVRVLHGDQPVSEVSERDAALVALAAAGELRTVVTLKDAKLHKKRITELGERSGGMGPVLEKVIAQVRAALAAAVTTAILVATTSSSGT
ncbi:GOLPH3/VPS74 family protein [Streptomyces coffeae]|uniref:GPP34 family phosphoprotein n=1 Tax=Streptomyces coffeae TaxID=621382 RepID=A0ABS1NMF2_9ACTN|nr:GPP34 family phosphoprotein [Streptomyces coffeae]MBL1100931.1 GPP34 family phosphoprotein [Streptomyces coffeae]